MTENHAAMWTDGRYFLQASTQLDDNWILMKEGNIALPVLRIRSLLILFSCRDPGNANKRGMARQNASFGSQNRFRSDDNGIFFVENAADTIGQKRPSLGAS